MPFPAEIVNSVGSSLALASMRLVLWETGATGARRGGEGSLSRCAWIPWVSRPLGRSKDGIVVMAVPENDGEMVKLKFTRA